jgi:hypothetical protein
MADQIIEQPDGRLAIFSNTSDTLIAWNATPEEVVEWFVWQEMREHQERERRAREWARAEIERVRTGQPGPRPRRGWSSALRADRTHGGDAWREFVNGQQAPAPGAPVDSLPPSESDQT